MLRFSLAAAAAAVVALSGAAHAATWQFTVVHAFAGADGECPNSPLVDGGDGWWYGTTRSGGAGTLPAGTVYRIDGQGRMQTVHQFSGNAPGGAPNGLVKGPDGLLYGVAGGSGYPYQPGLVFRIGPGGQYDVLHFFDLMAWPQPVVFGSDGALYGATSNGYSAWSGGIVYRLTTTGEFTVLHTLGQQYTDPWNTVGALAEQSPGVFIGAASAGGLLSQGAVYRVTTSGAFDVLHTFGNAPDGEQPRAGVAKLPDGSVVGTTVYATPYASGTIWQVDATGAFSIAHTFASDGGEGMWPASAVTPTPRGAILGTTTSPAVVYRFRDGVLDVLHDFATDGSEGLIPLAPPVRLPRGDLLGTTCYQGPGGFGTIYRMRPVR